METPFQWQQLLYAAYVTLLTVVLFVYLYHLYGSKERSRRIERRGMIPFSDEPLEERQ